MATINDLKSKIVRLNVGGTRYDVSRDTLECCEGSMLASLISDQWKEENSDDNEPIFIDRNGRLFEYVLDYLRTGKVYLPSTTNRTALKDELEFYGIGADMSNVIEKYGIEYAHALAMKIQVAENNVLVLKAEKMVVELCFLAEYEVVKNGYRMSTVTLHPSSDQYYMVSCREGLLRERLLDRGLKLVSLEAKGYPNAVYAITVEKAIA